MGRVRASHQLAPDSESASTNRKDLPAPVGVDPEGHQEHLAPHALKGARMRIRLAADARD